MAAYLGCPEEERILSMSMPFFDKVLEYIGKYVRYEAMANYAGNSFFKDSFEIIRDQFPLKQDTHENEHALSSLLKGVQLKGIQTMDSMPEWMVQAKNDRKGQGEQSGT